MSSLLQRGLVLVWACALLSSAACRKRPELLGDSPPTKKTEVAAEEEAPATKTHGPKPSLPPPPALGPSGLPMGPQTNAEPDKAPAPVGGFPVPDGMRLANGSMGNVSYETNYSLGALERFYRREVGRDGEVKKRAYGFEVTMRGNTGFVVVSQPPGWELAHVAVIGGLPMRERGPDLAIDPRTGQLVERGEH